MPTRRRVIERWARLVASIRGAAPYEKMNEKQVARIVKKFRRQRTP